MSLRTDHTMDMRTIKNQLSKATSMSLSERDIINLGMHPYADTFIGTDQLEMSEPVLPLVCTLNLESGLIKLKHTTDARERYNLYPYSYTSANSEYSREHWDSFFNDIPKLFYRSAEVMEIGSNDCYLLEKFYGEAKSVIGIDASADMCEIGKSKGLECVNEPFGWKTANKLGYEQYQLIIANNVFNHANDPNDFMLGIEYCLRQNGTFIFELPYWGSTISSTRFDQIYHEHISYFTVKYADYILRKVGMYISDISFNEYHGGSMRVYAKKGRNDNSMVVSSLIDAEVASGLFDVKKYEAFQRVIEVNRSRFMAKLHSIKAEDPECVIVGVGAAAKANTLLNYYGIDSTLMDFVTDSSELKQGKFTPLSRIPIVDDTMLANIPDDVKVYVVILAWNIEHKLRPIIENIRPNVEFLSVMQDEVSWK